MPSRRHNESAKKDRFIASRTDSFKSAKNPLFISNKLDEVDMYVATYIRNGSVCHKGYEFD